MIFIIIYGLNRKIFDKLVSEHKITNQGSKNKNSEQGLWFKYSNVKNDLIIINNDKDLIKLCKNI